MIRLHCNDCPPYEAKHQRRWECPQCGRGGYSKSPNFNEYITEWVNKGELCPICLEKRRKRTPEERLSDMSDQEFIEYTKWNFAAAVLYATRTTSLKTSLGFSYLFKYIMEKIS